MTEERSYSVDEADGMLPELRERLPRVREARAAMFAAARLVDDRMAADGGGAAVEPGYWQAQETLRADVAWLAVNDIVLRDPETGLVDFPGEREGRRVWLCWKLGEERVAHWHDLESGFLARRPL